MKERTFNCCCTLLDIVTLNENDVRALLDLSEEDVVLEEDWNFAIKETLKCKVSSGLFLEEFNDIEIEEQ